MPPLRHKFRDKLKPASGFSYLLHIAYRIALPIAIYTLVRLDIGLWLPILVIMLSKWRIFAVRPRFWPANLRANSVDIMVGISLVVFMSNSDSVQGQVFWAAMYGVWLLFIKPRSTIFFVSLQSGIGQLCALMALYLVRPDSSLYELVLLTGLICYLSARHFFDSFNEPYAKMLAYIWAYFGAALIWVLGHMLIVYPKPDGLVAMPTLILSAIGYGFAAVYYLEHFDRLSVLIKRELLFISGSIVLILIISLFYEASNLIV
ncbi:MAG: rane protein of unknown function [Candidatus Saccharibacteria bacterium]|nr:rane protein of unknown function [Candidatus Saccharibacteria bacterium]